MFNKLIEEICQEENISIDYLSNGWVIKLKKNDKERFISGYKFDLNNQALSLILDDKYATYELLKTLNIPVIEHNLLYCNLNKKDYAKEYNNDKYIDSILKKYNYNIVLKKNNGTCGTNVYHMINIDKFNDFYQYCDKKDESLSICPFYDIENEYRVIILNKEIKLIYKKIRPIVIGNGNKTIKELLIDFNKNYFGNYNDNNKDDILDKNEKFEYGWQFNLSRGSISSMDINEIDKDQIINIINDIFKNIDIRFGSIDIIKTKDNNYYVMEINSGVMMDNFIKQHNDGYDIAKKIYKEAILEMLK